MKVIDKVWLACAIDSEGTIGYYRRGFNQDGVPMWRISCYIGNSDRRYAEKCAYLMGAKVKERPEDKRIAKDGSPYKPRYYVEITHLKAYRIIKQILPYLIIKADKAREVLALYDDGTIPSPEFTKRRSKQLGFPEAGKQINLLPGALGKEVKVSKVTIDEWAEKSRWGEVCGIFGCKNKPVVKCPHCGNWYCKQHAFVLDTPGHQERGENEDIRV